MSSSEISVSAEVDLALALVPIEDVNVAPLEDVAGMINEQHAKRPVSSAPELSWSFLQAARSPRRPQRRRLPSSPVPSRAILRGWESAIMTLQIDLSPELGGAKLRERAAAAGKDAVAFAREAVEEKLRGRETLSEILGPIRKDFRDVPDAELDTRIQKAIAEARSKTGRA